MKNMKGQFGKTTELEDDLQSLCYLVEALGDLGIFKIAEETDTTTGADLNRLIAAVKGVLPDIDVEVASDTDTTTGANLNGLLVAIIKAVAAPICAQDENIAISGQKLFSTVEDSIFPKFHQTCIYVS